MKLDVESVITLDRFQLRWYQEPLWDAIENQGYRKVLAVMPRRCGKDITAWNLCIRQCLKRICLVYYVLPTYSQARKTIFDAISTDGVKFIDFIPKMLVEAINIAEMKIRFKNGSILQCIGGDSYDTSLVGTNPYAIVFSEYSRMTPKAYEFARPILAANGGWCMMLSTPFGKNHMWHLWKVAQDLPDWYVLHMKTSEIQHIPAAILAQERAQMSEELYLQEYECFPANSGILTPFGVNKIKDIQIGDLVISHTGRPRKVSAVMNKKYNGRMIVINSFGSMDNIICTPEHPIRIYNRIDQSYSWIPADKIKKDDFVVFPKTQIGEKTVISYELCMLIAWYITEGSGDKNYVQFSLGNNEEVDRVCVLLRSLGFDFVIFESTCIQVVVNSSQLLDFMKTNCGLRAHDKRIPFSLISGHQKEFFYELLRGDGCENTYKGYYKYLYTTISKSLAYQFQLLTHSIDEDFAAGITLRPGGKTIIEGREVKTQTSYSVQINIQKNKDVESPWLIRAKNCIAARVKEINDINYDDYVYNLSVQYDESYIVEGRSVHNCSFDRGVEGSYYSKNLEQLRQNGQITSVSWEPGLQVHVAMDIGVSDATTLIWFQVVGDGTVIRIIDCYSNTGQGLDHYAKTIQEKPYKYGKYFAPHDIKVREWGGGAISRYEKARQLGIDFTLLDQAGVMDGIENVWTHFPKFWIDENRCRSLINALDNYRREWDEMRGVYKDKPIHNWASNYADALRYLCMSLHKTKRGLTSEEFERKKAEALYGSRGTLPRFFDDSIKYDGRR